MVGKIRETGGFSAGTERVRSYEYDMAHEQNSIKLEPKDILPNINHTQAAERVEKCRFCP